MSIPKSCTGGDHLMFEFLTRRMEARRKSMRITRAALAKRSGVSLGSIRRFEREHQNSLVSLANIAFPLRCEDDFDDLFARREHASIEEVIRDAKRGRR